MTATKPTIDAGGQMILLSTANKGTPGSRFKQIFRAARQGLNDWFPIFLPWWARPERSAAWYAAQKRDVYSATGSLDDVHQEYPATDTEALAPRTLDKRIAGDWIEQCYVAMAPVVAAGAPSIPQLEVYRAPEAGRRYVMGADPAEGNPTSDDSALTVLEWESGEECAVLAAKVQPAVFGGHLDGIGRWYNDAAVMVERNNHGHALLLWLAEHSALRVLDGQDGRPGWHSTVLGKTLLYDSVAEAFRNEVTTLHSFESYVQLASIEGRSLRAPEGERDDRADAFALATVARAYATKSKRRQAKVA